MVVDRGRIEGRKPTAAKAADEGPSSTGDAAKSARATTTIKKSGGVRVLLEPLEGFATVLDFEADLSAVGVLPVKVTVRNNSRRRYEFDPRDVVLRVADSRRRARTLPADEVLRRLAKAVQGAGKAASELGNVDAARPIVVEKQLRPASLPPGMVASGFLYFDSGSYDRARIVLVDSATGESEGFLVEF